MHKSITIFAKKAAASVVMGAKVPIIMTSRSDTIESKLCSLKLAMAISK